ncbi:hypothetical protein QBC40DRAFT_270827 [Triangularia verruculosa]|uniref:Uncharacterized protein n=1 Tax=Triangularia verruculosa TaxID=2587418 RepID=A0AAN7AZX1_9PEZI|nr:hypothetical protein QBC40DRAFT_270827 [Triangularia verruculosa]
MYTFSKATALASLAALASAQSNLEIAREAYRNPNDSYPIKFKPFPAAQSRQLAGLEWTWRVNITDSLTDPFNNQSTDFTVRTSYEFIYEGAPLNSTLNETLPGLGNQSFCTVQLILKDAGWPANVTNLWTDENANSTSCAPVLGQDCVDAIIKSVGHNNGGTCGDPGGSWGDAPECASSLGYLYQERLVTGRSFGNLASARSGEPFATMASSEYSDLDNKTLYENYVNVIHVVLLNAPVSLARGANGAFPSDDPKALICMRVRTSQRDVDDGEGGNNDSGNGDGDSDGGNGGGNDGNDEEGSEGGNEGGGGNAAGRDAANWSTMIGALILTAFVGAAL